MSRNDWRTYHEDTAFGGISHGDTKTLGVSVSRCLGGLFFLCSFYPLCRLCRSHPPGRPFTITQTRSDPPRSFSRRVFEFGNTPARAAIRVTSLPGGNSIGNRRQAVVLPGGLPECGVASRFQTGMSGSWRFKSAIGQASQANLERGTGRGRVLE